MTQEYSPQTDQLSSAPDQELKAFQEKQPAMQRAEELVIEDTRWTRSTTLSPEAKITSKEDPTKSYEIEAVLDPEQPELAQVQQILENTFSVEEVDPIEYLQAGIKGEKVNGEKDVAKYQVYVIKDKGEVVAFYTGGTLHLTDAAGNETNQMIFMGAYAITVASHLRQGLARELYTSALIGAVREAELQGKKLIGVIGETTTVSEKAWESVKRRRVYVEDKLSDGTIKRTEVPYVQPALDFDEDGNPEEGTGESAEHLMVDFFGEGMLTKDTLVAMVRAIYRWCNLWSKDDFEDEERSNEEAEAAYQNNLNYVNGFEQALEKFLDSHGNIVVMNSKEKDQAITEGVIVETHSAADEE